MRISQIDGGGEKIPREASFTFYNKYLNFLDYLVKFYAVIPTIFLWWSTLKFFTFGECEGSTHDGAVWKSRAAGRSQFSFCRVGSGDPALGGSLLYPPLPPDVSHFCGGVFIVTSASWVGWVGEILTIPFVPPPWELSWSPQFGWVPLLFVYC